MKNLNWFQARDLAMQNKRAIRRADWTRWITYFGSKIWFTITHDATNGAEQSCVVQNYQFTAFEFFATDWTDEAWSADDAWFPTGASNATAPAQDGSGASSGSGGGSGGSGGSGGGGGGAGAAGPPDTPQAGSVDPGWQGKVDGSVEIVQQKQPDGGCYDNPNERTGTFNITASLTSGEPGKIYAIQVKIQGRTWGCNLVQGGSYSWGPTGFQFIPGGGAITPQITATDFDTGKIFQLKGTPWTPPPVCSSSSGVTTVV